MSTNFSEPIMEKETVIIPSTNAEETARNVFTHQTGQVLLTLGTLFKHVPPFNDTIDKSTSDTLISIGKKLKATK
jgi:hypothetical protein